MSKPLSAYDAVLFFNRITYYGFLWEELGEVDTHAQTSQSSVSEGVSVQIVFEIQLHLNKQRILAHNDDYDFVR